MNLPTWKTPEMRSYSLILNHMWRVFSSVTLLYLNSLCNTLSNGWTNFISIPILVKVLMYQSTALNKWMSSLKITTKGSLSSIILRPTHSRKHVLLMEEILHHLGCIKPWKTYGINYLSTGAGFLPSTVCIYIYSTPCQARAVQQNIISSGQIKSNYPRFPGN